VGLTSSTGFPISVLIGLKCTVYELEAWNRQTDGQIAALPNAPIGVGIISYVVCHCTVNYVAICVLVCSDFVLHTHPFNGPFSGTCQVSQYQKVKTNLDFTEARDSEWQWHQLGHMQVCTLLQTDTHASTPPLSFFTGRMPFLPPNQQHQSTEGKVVLLANYSV